MKRILLESRGSADVSREVSGFKEMLRSYDRTSYIKLRNNVALENYMKTRRLSISNKMSLTIIILIVFSTSAFSVMANMLLSRFMLNKSRDEAMYYAKIASAGIDTDNFLAIKEGGKDTPEYKKLLDLITDFTQSEEVVFIYCMKYNENGDVVFVADSDSEDPAEIGEIYSETTPEMLRALEGEACGDQYVSSDEWGNFISGYAPVLKDGKTIGIVGVDCKVEYIKKQVDEMMFYLVIIAVVSIVVGIIVAMLVGGGLRRNFVTLNNKVLDMASEYGDLNEDLELHSGDELERIAESINRLIHKVKNDR